MKAKVYALEFLLIAYWTFRSLLCRKQGLDLIGRYRYRCPQCLHGSSKDHY
jgi:hypothetical protein